MLTEIIGIFTYLGITPDKTTPIIILGVFIVIYLKISLNPISKSIRRMTNAINEIQTSLKSLGLSFDHLLTEAPGSPLRPTEHGAKLIRESGMEGILDRNKEFLVNKLKDSLPENYTDYDVQEMARGVLISLKNDPMMNPIKEYAYKNALEADRILRVAGLWLRDDFLNQPREISKKQSEAG